MDEFTDYENIDTELMATEVLNGFCDRYINDALRVINTGHILIKDADMCKLALAVIIALYFKNLSEDIKTDDRMIH
jgi:hypothetical protein